MSGGLGTARASAGDDLLREVLRQQSSAEKNICGAVQKTIGEGADVRLVVRTALELGHSSCHVIRCAVEGGANIAKVLQGAAEAGVTSDVMARCAVEAGADPGAVAAILSGLTIEPNFCYFTFAPASAPTPAPPPIPEAERSYAPPAQFSPYIP